MNQHWIDGLLFVGIFGGGLLLTLLQETIITRVQQRRANRATSDTIQ